MALVASAVTKSDTLTTAASATVPAYTHSLDKYVLVAFECAGNIQVTTPPAAPWEAVGSSRNTNGATTVVYGARSTTTLPGSTVALTWAAAARTVAAVAVVDQVSAVPQFFVGSGASTPALQNGTIGTVPAQVAGFGAARGPADGSTLTFNDNSGSYSPVQQASTAAATPAQNTGGFLAYKTMATTALAVAQFPSTGSVAAAVVATPWATVHVVMTTGAAPNQPPTVSLSSSRTAGVKAGEAFTLTLSAADVDGTIASSTLTQTAGPTSPLTLVDADHRAGEAPYTLAGTTLTYSLVAVDNSGASATATVSIAVLPAGRRVRLADGTYVPVRRRRATGGVVAGPTGRAIYLWPFAQDSIWNMPIGSGAVYVPAGLLPATAWEGGKITVDPEQIGVDAQAQTYPLRTLTSGDGVAGGQVFVPPNMVHAPTDPGNGCATFLRADGRTVWQGQPLSLTARGDPSWLHTTQSQPTDLYGPGIEGAHGGAHMSAIGGSLRPGELTSTDPIRHVLKVNLYGLRFISNTGGGKRWPASTADSGYATKYGGTVPALRMGALLALRPDVDLTGVTDPKARKLAVAFRDYGAYLVDDTAWDVHAIALDEQLKFSGEWPDVNAEFHAQVMGVFTALHVVDNNGPASIGGGGTPRASLAPALAVPAGYAASYGGGY